MISSEAARFLGVTVQTFWTWAKKRRLPYVVVGQGHYFKARDVERLADRMVG